MDTLSFYFYSLLILWLDNWMSCVLGVSTCAQTAQTCYITLANRDSKRTRKNEYLSKDSRVQELPYMIFNKYAVKACMSYILKALEDCCDRCNHQFLSVLWQGSSANYRENVPCLFTSKNWRKHYISLPLRGPPRLAVV